jgi:hypothetical protein
MPIDPSIIGNVMAPQAVQMPDVNAMMRTQTQGMENIYQIEAAREAQAKEEAKAQEDAAVKALLPAYAYILTNPADIDGGAALVPPNMRENVMPYLDQIRGQSPDQVVAALTGSLVTSDVGRAFLENQSRMATLGVQQGQLDVSRQDLVLRRQKQALDARGEGDWEWKEGVDANGNLAFAWVNPRTRQVVMADLSGGAAPAPGAVPGPTPIPAPDVVTPRQPAPGMSEVPPPAGAVQPPAFRPKPKEGAEKGLNEGEGKSYNFAIRMIDSDAVANELEKEGVLTTDAVTDAVVGALRALPTVAGGNLSEQIQNALNVVSPSLSPEEQRLAVAQLDFVTAVLRSESGAEIKTSEFPAEYRKYFPVEGDENNPKLLADKKRRRQNAIEGMKTRAGKSGRSQIEAYFAGEGAGAPPAAVPTAPGATNTSGFKIRAVRQQ